MGLPTKTSALVLGLFACFWIPTYLGSQPPAVAPPGSPTGAPATGGAPGAAAPGAVPAAAQPGAANNASRTVGREADLVEKVLSSRKEYQRSLEGLRLHYLQTNHPDKAKWAEDELIQYHRIAKQPFIFDLDVPPASLGQQATQNSPEANEYYRRAMTYKDRGWGNDYIDNQRRAEILLQQILTSYPTSNRISDTAYQLGELYEGKAYKQFQRAAIYYDRSVQWNPQQAEGRIRAAKLYEQQNIDRNRALELYREVTTHDTDPRRVEEAKQRLEQLSRPR